MVWMDTFDAVWWLLVFKCDFRHSWLQPEVSILWKLVDQKRLSPCRPCTEIRFQNASWNDIKLMPELYFITWLRHIRSGSKEKFSFNSSGTMLIPCALFQLPTHGYLFFRSGEGGWGEAGSRWWWRDEGVLSHYMYLSVCIFTCGCHLTWQVYQCPRLIRTRPSAWQAEPTAPQSRLTAPQVAGGGKEEGREESVGERHDKGCWGVKEHTHNKRSKLKLVNILK